MTADHKVLNEGCESRDRHGTLSWYKILPLNGFNLIRVKTKSSHETERNLSQFLEPSHKPTVVHTDNVMEFGKACEDLSWNHRTSTPHRSETNGIAGRAIRRVKEGTSAVLLQSGLDERWWSDSVECYCYLRNVQDLLADGKTPCERRFGEPFKGPIIRLGVMVEYHPISPRDQSRFHDIGKKVLPGIFLGYELVAVKLWKGDILIADLEDLERLEASEIFLRRINAKEVLIRPKDGEFANSENPLQGGTARREDPSRELQGESEGPQPAGTAGDAEARADFWSIQGDFICRHQSELRVQFHVPKEETFPVPRPLIQMWACCKKKGLTITGMSIRTDLCQIRGEDLLCRKKSVQKDFCGSVGHRQKVQTTTRPENVWPQVWTKIGKASHKREKQERANEKPRLDNARRLRGIYFIDPDDRDHTETVKNARIQFGKMSGSSHAVQKISKWHHESGCEGGRLHPNRFQKRFMSA